jgi:2-polyprenyl-3-methyl-5-hydroxy-6-metoxy-1,4-benzoquinol methylase
MSEEDRKKWNERYAAGAFAERSWPSALLAETLAGVHGNGARALDLGCGAGRNALYLAELGFRVDGVDISAVALERAARTAAERGLEVRWIQADLDEPVALSGPYELIVNMRYLNVALIARLARDALAPGGRVIVEQHLRTDADVVGPSTSAFRAPPGALREALSGLRIERDEEGVFEDPDGRRVALSRIVASR